MQRRFDCVQLLRLSENLLHLLPHPEQMYVDGSFSIGDSLLPRPSRGRLLSGAAAACVWDIREKSVAGYLFVHRPPNLPLRLTSARELLATDQRNAVKAGW